MIKRVNAFTKCESLLPKTMKILHDPEAIKEVEDLFEAFRELAIKRYPIKAKTVAELIKQTLKLNTHERTG